MEHCVCGSILKARLDFCTSLALNRVVRNDGLDCSGILSCARSNTCRRLTLDSLRWFKLHHWRFNLCHQMAKSLPKWFGFHEIWHLFVMGGAFCHFWAIAFHLV